MEKTYNVLVVEDEERIRKGIKKLLEEIIGGLKVIAEGCNGREGLKQFEIHAPDMVVTDIRMPKMNGLEMVKIIRNKKLNIPIIVLSGYDEFVYVQQALRDNVIDYLLKPVDHVELTKAVDKAKTILSKKYKAEEKENVTEIKEDNHIIRYIKRLIETNMDRDLFLQNISDEVNLNYNYLSTMFKENTGMNFSDYVINERIKRACKLLIESNLRIYDIARLCGYPNAKYFMVLFKKVTGKTPSEYREKKSIV